MAIATIKPDLFEFDSYSKPETAQQTSVIKETTAPPAKVTASKPAPKAEVVVEAAKPAVIDAKASVKPAKPVQQAKPTKPAVKPASSKPASKVSSGYYVQLGAFNEQPRAQGLVDQLKQHGWKAVISKKSSGLFAVWAGPGDRKAAENLQTAIESKLKIKGFIIHHTGA